MNPFLIVMLLAGSAVAQTVRITNYGNLGWEGWVRIPVEGLPPWHGGWTTPLTTSWVRAADGEDADVFLRLAPGAFEDVPFGTMGPVVRPTPLLPSDPYAFWLGVPSVSGVPLGWSYAGADGAAVSVKGTTVVGSWAVTLWFRYYPSAPSHVLGTVRLVSEPTGPVTQASDLRLTWGDATILGGVGGLTSNLLSPSGSVWGTSEERVLNVAAVWPRLMRSSEEWSWAYAAQAGSVRR